MRVRVARVPLERRERHVVEPEPRQRLGEGVALEDVGLDPELLVNRDVLADAAFRGRSRG